MAQHGGYRRPGSPAPVSGPGQLSQRTDGGPSQPIRVPTGGAYGSASALRGIEASAPMEAAAASAAAKKPQARAQAVNPAAGLTPFNAPTQRPREPVTNGAALGPGAGPEALGLQAPAAASYQSAISTLQSIGAASGSSEVAALLNQFQLRN